jgi:hypothetical protein
MPTIYFNDKLRRNLNQGLFTREYGGQSQNGQYGLRNYTVNTGGSSTQQSYGTIKLMKGTVPLDFSGLTTSSSRSSDTLVTWTTNQAGFSFNEPTTNIDGIAEIDSGYSTASASGIATWFWWYVTQTYSSTDTLLQLVGTVGTSGTDLIIADTTIIAGANYRFLNLKFDIPTEYTY